MQGRYTKSTSFPFPTGLGGLGPTLIPWDQGTHLEILPMGDHYKQVEDCSKEVMMSPIPLHALLWREGDGTWKLWITRDSTTQRH